MAHRGTNHNTKILSEQQGKKTTKPASVWGSKSLGSRNIPTKELGATKSVCMAVSLSSIILERKQDEPGLWKGSFSIFPKSRRKGEEDGVGIS